MKRDPYKDDQLLELIDNLCNFILDQIVHVKGTYHDRESNLGRNPQYQHICNNLKIHTPKITTTNFFFLKLPCDDECHVWKPNLRDALGLNPT